MDLGSIFLILALLILVGLYVSRPFFERQESAVEVPVDTLDHQRSALLAERDRILNALQELDFDYALGKIPEADYPGQRALLLHNGAEVLRQLDVMQAEAGAEDAETRLEAAIAARRADASSTASAKATASGRGVRAAAVAAPDDEVEAMLANRRRVRSEKSAGFCPQCGGAIRQSDRFCPKCGHDLS